MNNLFMNIFKKQNWITNLLLDNYYIYGRCIQGCTVFDKKIIIIDYILDIRLKD